LFSSPDPSSELLRFAFLKEMLERLYTVGIVATRATVRLYISRRGEIQGKSIFKDKAIGSRNSNLIMEFLVS